MCRKVDAHAQSMSVKNDASPADTIYYFERNLTEMLSPPASRLGNARGPSPYQRLHETYGQGLASTHPKAHPIELCEDLYCRFS